MRERTTASSTEQGSPLTRKTAPGGFPEDTTDMLLRGPEEGPPSTPSQPHWPTLPSCRRGDRGPGGGMVVTYPRSLAAGVSFLPAMPPERRLHSPLASLHAWLLLPAAEVLAPHWLARGGGGSSPGAANPKGRGCTPLRGWPQAGRRGGCPT